MKRYLEITFIFAALIATCYGECKLNLNCLSKSATLDGKYSTIASGTFSMNYQEMESFCREWPALLLCLQTQANGCPAGEKLNLNILDQYVKYTCGEGREVFLNGDNCLGKAIFVLRPPPECVQALNTTAHTPVEFMLEQVSKPFDDKVCRSLITSRDCGIEPYTRMCGDYTIGESNVPAVANYWRKSNNQVIKAMTGTTDPDCSQFKITTPSPTVAGAITRSSSVKLVLFLSFLLILIHRFQ